MQKILLLLEESAEGLSTEELIRLTAPTEELSLSNGHRVWAINELIYTGKAIANRDTRCEGKFTDEGVGKVDLRGGDTTEQ